MAVVMVTGAGGFLGGCCVNALIERGDSVVAVVRDRDPEAAFYAEGLFERCIEVRAELATDERLVERYEPDIILHLAGQSQVPLASRSPGRTFESNVQATWTLLEACRVARRPPRAILLASSDKAYGPSDRPYTEEMPLFPVNPYDVSKAALDMIGRSYARRYGLPVLITRCANIYGPGDLHVDRLIPGTCRSLLQGTPVVLRSTGSMRREWIHVEDVVSAILLLVDGVETVEWNVFNIGSGECESVNGVLARLFDIAGRLAPVHREEVDDPGEIPSQALDSGRLRSLGWAPRWTLQEGLTQTWRWHVTRNWTGGRIA